MFVDARFDDILSASRTPHDAECMNEGESIIYMYEREREGERDERQREREWIWRKFKF